MNEEAAEEKLIEDMKTLYTLILKKNQRVAARMLKELKKIKSQYEKDIKLSETYEKTNTSSIIN
jgi:hypothetical protein